MLETSATLASLSKALVEFQGEVGTIPKTKTVMVKTDKGSYSYTYAPLDAIKEFIQPILAKNKLAVSQFPSGVNNLTTMLLHESGEFIRDTAEIPTTSKRAQDVGGALTYMRRYALAAVLGIVTDEDIDAPAGKGKNPDKATKDQLEEIEKLRVEVDMTTVALNARCKELYGISLPQLNQTQASGVIAGLKKRVTK